jgi:hypothetical protein
MNAYQRVQIPTPEGRSVEQIPADNRVCKRSDIKMDGLSAAASLIALLQISNSIIQYLAEIGGSSMERLQLLMELSNTTMLLTMLKDAPRDTGSTEAWNSTMKRLQGPLDQFQKLLEKLAARLAPNHGIKKLGRAVLWPFHKDELKDIFSSLERYKTLLGLAMHNDHM